jgi:FAD/FMN-containing dehydrogenase
VTSRPVHHTERPLDELRASPRGDLISPDSDEYDEARRVWNGTIDRRPALVARCLGVADVIIALRFARSHDLTVAVRGGGHNVAGFSTCDGGMVIDLSRMIGVRVDLGTRTARAEGGLTWGAFDHETQAFGLATTGGLVTSTGIGGLTLGGGIGWLMRKHGLTADNLVAADVVTADGELITANTDIESELLWGLRGGGGNFGVVTSFEYQLHAVGPVVLGGAILHPAHRASDLLGFYAEWTRTLPEELTTLFAFLTAPPEPFVPVELQGTPMVAVALCYTGRIGEGEAALRPLREFAAPAVDVVMPMPYTLLQAMFDATSPRGIHAYWKTEYLDELDAAAIDVLVTQAAEMTGLSSLTAIQIHHLEGAIRQQPPGGSAFSHRDPRFVLNIVGNRTDTEPSEPHIRWARDTWDAIRAHSIGDPYLNFLGDEGAERVRAAYGDETFTRLVALKNRFDPSNVFRLNQNIPPGAIEGTDA